MKYNKIIGSLGEKMAADILEQQGYEVIARNYTCKLGEIDIIAMDTRENVLSFIEVKTRTSDNMVIQQRQYQPIKSVTSKT